MKILIVEDEAVTARRLERMLREALGSKIHSLMLKESLIESEEFLFDHPIDLLMLDLNLNGENGFELLKTAAAGAFKTIVVSGNPERAIEAFDFGVIDFIPKPFDTERLQKALDRLESHSRSTQSAKYLSIRKFGKMELIPIDQVLFFQGSGDYVEVHLKNGRVELHTKTLEALENLLPEPFERIHKSYIADLREMLQIRLYGGGKYELELKNGKRLPISRMKYKELKEKI